MTSADCFEVGYLCFLSEDFAHATLWMNETLQRLYEENQIGGGVEDLRIAETLDHLAYSLFREG